MSPPERQAGRPRAVRRLIRVDPVAGSRGSRRPAPESEAPPREPRRGGGEVEQILRQVEHSHANRISKSRGEETEKEPRWTGNHPLYTPSKTHMDPKITLVQLEEKSRTTRVPFSEFQFWGVYAVLGRSNHNSRSEAILARRSWQVMFNQKRFQRTFHVPDHRSLYQLPGQLRGVTEVDPPLVIQ